MGNLSRISGFPVEWFWFGSRKTPTNVLCGEHYERLRANTPTDSIRNMVNEGKKVDPVYGYKVDKLEADHIVAMKTITEMKDFSRLSTENQLKVLNNPDNFMGLGKSSNASKQDKSWAEWEEHSILGKVPEKFKAEMIEKEKGIGSLLENQIQTLLKTQRETIGE
jgi:hypothetical protein